MYVKTAFIARENQLMLNPDRIQSFSVPLYSCGLVSWTSYCLYVRDQLKVRTILKPSDGFKVGQMVSKWV